MSTVSMSRSATVRPGVIVAAVALLVFKAVVGNVALGVDAGLTASVIAVGSVSVGINLFAAWGLWNRRRWGWIMSIVLTLFDVVAGAPMLFDASGWFAGAIILFLGIEAVTLVLLMLPETRRAIRGS